MWHGPAIMSNILSNPRHHGVVSHMDENMQGITDCCNSLAHDDEYQAQLCKRLSETWQNNSWARYSSKPMGLQAYDIESLIMYEHRIKFGSGNTTGQFKS